MPHALSPEQLAQLVALAQENAAETRIVHVRSSRFDFYIGRGESYIRARRNQRWAQMQSLEWHLQMACASGYFGNRYRLGTDGDRKTVLKKYKRWFWRQVNEDQTFRLMAMCLSGHTWGCFCKQPDEDIPCHGDVIRAWLIAGCPLKEAAYA
jgi:hypothetical protein